MTFVNHIPWVFVQVFETMKEHKMLQRLQMKKKKCQLVIIVLPSLAV